jgi:hypothetical protein
MSTTLRKCPFCSKLNNRDIPNCKKCHKYIIEINNNDPNELTKLCESYIDEKFTKPSSVSFITKYFDKIGVDEKYYDEYLEKLRRAESIKNRSIGLAKLGLGVILLIAAGVQCTFPVIWLLPFGLCVVGGIMFITLGAMAIKSGNQ